jgi:hypothetical protein
MYRQISWYATYTNSTKTANSKKVKWNKNLSVRWKSTDVSKENFASIFRNEKHSKQTNQCERRWRVKRYNLEYGALPQLTGLVGKHKLSNKFVAKSVPMVYYYARCVRIPLYGNDRSVACLSLHRTITMPETGPVLWSWIMLLWVDK